MPTQVAVSTPQGNPSTPSHSAAWRRQCDSLIVAGVLKYESLAGVQVPPKTRADLFDGFKFEGLPFAKEHLENIIKTAVIAIRKLDKMVTDAIWSLKHSNRKKVKAVLKKYNKEVERLPGLIRKLLAASAPANTKMPRTPRG
jgi:hypothetical protein